MFVFYLLLFCVFVVSFFCVFFFFKQKTAYEMRISDWSSDVCSSDLIGPERILYQFGCCVRPPVWLRPLWSYMAPPACFCLRVSVTARFSSCGPSRGKVEAGGRPDYFPIKPLTVLARFRRSARPLHSLSRTGTGPQTLFQPTSSEKR